MLDLETLTIRECMAVGLFLMGLRACAGGLWTILAREYQQTLRHIAAQSDRLHARAMSEVGVVPILDASTNLVEAVNQLIRTAMGVGAFLCLIGVGMCALAWWMIL